jgi:hypothetical protein
MSSEMKLSGLWVYGIGRHFQQYFSYFAAAVLLVEETGAPGENHRPAVSH